MDTSAAAADPTGILSGAQASRAVNRFGWRYLLGTLQGAVPVTSVSAALAVSVELVRTAGPQAEDLLRLDLRRDRVILTLVSPTTAGATPREVHLARRLAGVVEGLGLSIVPAVDGLPPTSVQALEIAIDALDIAAIRPFWKAVMAYVDEPGADALIGPLVDPRQQGPAIWFQQMDRPRPQRNRIHLDICVPHDEAPGRLQGALAMGGRLVSDRRAPAFWILADVEGNEVCITTWQGRD